MESIFAFLNDIYDELIFSPELEFDPASVQIDGLSGNSIQKAAEILRQYFDMKIPHVIINKKLPMAAGLGGGSSDSACFINTVFDIWDFSTEEKTKYLHIFKDLGADNMIFLHKYFYNHRFVYLNGTGLEGEISGIDLDYKNDFVLIINNGEPLSTKAVFDVFDEQFNNERNAKGIHFDLLKNFHNSLQSAAIKLLPSLSQVIADLNNTNPILFGVSGSGSSCFGLYNNKTEAKIALNSLNYKYKMISCL